MQFPSPLIIGKLVKRYKRFLADIQLDSGEIITAHCANSGSMQGLTDEGSKVWITKVPEDSDRKLRYDWHLIQPPGTHERVGINTSHPNKLVHEALTAKSIKPLAMYDNIRPEMKYGAQNSRIDFFLSHEAHPDCYVEVKNVTLKNGNALLFPDAVTARGAKHLQELTLMKDQGHRAVVLYIAQRKDGDYFTVAKGIDPTYAEVAQSAKQKGVEFYAYYCDITDRDISISQELTIRD